MGTHFFELISTAKYSVHGLQGSEIESILKQTNTSKVRLQPSKLKIKNIDIKR